MDSQAAEGVVASTVEVLAIAEVSLETVDRGPFSEEERAYAHSKSDPQRRLAARLAAKRAAVRLLGGGLDLHDVEVLRGAGGPPTVRLSSRARARLRALGAERILVSLTHGQEHAAAAVLLLRR